LVEEPLVTNRCAVATTKGRGFLGLPALTILCLVSVVGSTAGTGAYAQAATEPQETTGARKRSDAALLEDFIHFTKVRNYEATANAAQELLDRNLGNAAIVKLVEKDAATRRQFDEAVQVAIQNPVARPAAAGLQTAFEKGQLERARNADQITQNIKDLTGPARAQMLARARLIEAGEYAMPQLLDAYLDRSQAAVHPRLQQVFREMGRQAIVPLVTAMMKVGPNEQERIADLLGLMQYRTSIPFLADLASNSSVDAVKAAATRAINNLGGAMGTTADLYRSLAESYYDEKSELTSFPGEDHQLLWTYDPSGGLTMTAIRTPVFHEAMSMALLERGLALEAMAGPPNPDTLALWISSNFSREIDSPKDYTNPAYAAGRRPAMYFAVASGADVSQRVLARALDDRDTPLARHALAAVEETAGGHNLWNSGGRMPLLEALTYPSRRVQYEAALALAKAQPQNAFAGSDRVVPVLASSIRGATSQFAVVLTPDAETYQGMRRTLTNLGYTVLPQGRTLSELAQPIAEAPAIDLIVTMGLNGERVPAVISEVRAGNKTAATPVLALTSAESYSTLRHRYVSEASIAVRQVGIPEDALTRTIQDLLTASTGGPVTEQEARDYANRALAALRDLAVSNNTVLSIADAAIPLIGTLNDASFGSRMQVAEILSYIPQERAQRAIMEAAMTATGADRVSFLGMVADSAKRHGNLLEVRAVAWAVDLAAKGNDEEATAAAALMGALNLPNAELVGLIAQKK
jgi:hypothetical protein